MKKRRISIWIMIIAVCAVCLPLNSCGSMRSYWGVEGNYDFDDYYGGHHHKHKKPKPPKHWHKKHHHHHHDDD